MREITRMEKLAIVIPCFNEETVLKETSRRLIEILELMIKDSLISADSYLLFVNDGSEDNTWPLIESLYHENPANCGVNLTSNVGHQRALIAGLNVASENADMIITIDADLQDDEYAILKMVQLRNDGFDVVYGVRKSRETDTWFKRNTALAFYRFMATMGVKTIYNHADFRLMSKRAVKGLLAYPERNLYIRGIIPLIGFKSAKVFYDRKERFAGETKYSLTKMVSLAFDGITSFSVRPVLLVLYLGILFVIVSFGILFWVIWTYTQHRTVQGWTSLMLSIWFCSGCVLIGVGVVGQYIGKIYTEVKGRPRFNIERILM